MYSISETYYAELHTLSLPEMSHLKDSFKRNFPWTIDVFVSQQDYARMVEDCNELAGDGHPESTTEYQNKSHGWSEYHPKNSHVYKNGAILLHTLVGFASRKAAMQFKLKWFQN